MTLASLVLFVVGLLLVIFSAEQLVKAAIGTSLGFGISTFLVSVLFLGFDPENLAVGAVGSLEGMPGITLGSILGATMVTVALAFGITALIVPMRFEQVPRQILAVPIVAVLLFAGLAWDTQLTRSDGAVLLLAFVVAVLYLLWLGQQGFAITAPGDVAETLEQTAALRRWKSLLFLFLSLAGIVVGSELLVSGSRAIIASLGLSDTVFGMTILAFLLDIEELARELPAARRGRFEMSFGNVLGSILAFFLFNAGMIALLRPVAVDALALTLYLPLTFLTILFVTGFMLTKRISRWKGAILVLLYCLFVIAGYVP